jgi:ABC-type transport system substrate-binding protein
MAEEVRVRRLLVRHADAGRYTDPSLFRRRELERQRAWSNEKFNKILGEARSELDAGKRAGMYRELQLLVRDEGGVVIPLFANDVFAISSRIGHGKLADNYECDGRMFFDRWWFAS